MSIYRILLDEYKNEEMAKKQTFKIAKDILVDFGMRGDLYKTYEVLLDEYKRCNDEAKRFELYQKIEVLQNAMTIVKKANSVGK